MRGVSVPDENDRCSAGPLAGWLRDLAMRDRCAAHEIDPAPVSASLPGRGLDGQPCAAVEQRHPGDDGSRTIRGWPAARTRSAEVRSRLVRRDGARWRAGLGAWVAARLWLACRRFVAHDQLVYGAALAFVLLGALFPVLLLLLVGASMVVQPRGGYETLIGRLPEVPGTGALVIDTLRAAFARRGSFGTAGLLGLLLTATGVVSVVEKALNQAWEVRSRRFPRRHLCLLAAVGVFVVYTVLSLVAVLFSARAVRHALLLVEPGAPSRLWLASGPLLVVLSFGVSCLSYRFLPTRPVGWRRALIGALVATGLGVPVTIFLPLYLKTIADPSRLYDSFGAVVALLVWLYAAAVVFLFGAEVAALPPEGDPAGLPSPVWRSQTGQDEACQDD